MIGEVRNLSRTARDLPEIWDVIIVPEPVSSILIVKYLPNGEKKIYWKRNYGGIWIKDQTEATTALTAYRGMSRTAIHETIHFFHPDERESWVRQAEKDIILMLKLKANQGGS